MKKAVVLNAIKEMPKDFNLDDLVERLIVIEKIDEGLKQVQEGKTISNDKVKKMVQKWNK